MLHGQISHKWSAFLLNMDGHEVQPKMKMGGLWVEKIELTKIFGPKMAKINS